MAATTAVNSYRFRKPRQWVGDAAPTVDNSETYGFGIGDQFIDKTNNRAYLCVSATSGAASWISVGTPKADTGTAVSNAAIAVTEDGAEGFHKTTLVFTAYSLTMTDQGAAGSQGSLKLYDFPEGVIRILGAVVNLTIARVGTALTTTSAIVGALGTAAAGTGNATLLTTEADIISSTTCTLTAGAGTFVAINAAPITVLTDNTGGSISNTLAAQTGSYVQATIQNSITSLAAKINELIAVADRGTTFDGTGTAKDLYLNFATPDAGSTGDDALTVTGTIQWLWANYGDK